MRAEGRGLGCRAAPDPVPPPSCSIVLSTAKTVSPGVDVFTTQGLGHSDRCGGCTPEGRWGCEEPALTPGAHLSDQSTCGEGAASSTWTRAIEGLLQAQGGARECEQHLLGPKLQERKWKLPSHCPHFPRWTKGARRHRPAGIRQRTIRGPASPEAMAHSELEGQSLKLRLAWGGCEAQSRTHTRGLRGGRSPGRWWPARGTHAGAGRGRGLG